MTNFGKGYWIDRFQPSGSTPAPGGKPQVHDLTGQVVDGKTVYALPTPTNALELVLYYNGQMVMPTDYSVNGTQLTLIGIAPKQSTQDTLVAVY